MKTSGSSSPLRTANKTCIAESLEEFHNLVRKFHVDRIYLDLLEVPSSDVEPARRRYCVLLSASKSGTDVLARLAFMQDKHPDGTSAGDAQTYLNVLRSRFLFLGYSTSDGLASARLARELPETPAA